MYKKTIAITLIFIFLMSCGGCSGSWRRKFVRKKKADIKEEPVLQPQDYSKEFTNKQLYANHFAFWRSAESEFINCLTAQKNNKRLRTYASYTATELKRLHDLLTEEKQKEILPFLQEMEDIISKIEEPDYVNSHRNLLISTSSKHYRSVGRKFSFYSMREYIRPDKGKVEKAGEADRPEETLKVPEKVREETEGAGPGAKEPAEPEEAGPGPDRPEETGQSPETEPEETSGEPEEPAVMPGEQQNPAVTEPDRPEAHEEQAVEPEKTGAPGESAGEPEEPGVT